MAVTVVKKSRAKKTATKPRKSFTAKKKSQQIAEVKKTLISVLLDRSGSMEAIRDAAIEGFNKFVNQQRDAKDVGKAWVTLVQFDTLYEPNFVGEVIENVPPLTRESYVPRGSTALLDSLSRAIGDTEKWLVQNPGWKGNVLFLVVSDGEENSSRETTLGAVARQIAAKEQEGWTFVYIGAHLDAYGEAQRLGVSAFNTMQTPATAGGMTAAWSTTANATANYRSSAAPGTTVTDFYALEQKSGSGHLDPDPDDEDED